MNPHSLLPGSGRPAEAPAFEAMPAAALHPGNENASDNFFDLFEEAPIPYVHEGLDSKFIRVNRAARELLGLRPGEVTSTFGRSLVAGTPQSQERLNRALHSVAHGKEEAGVVLELRRRDNGNPLWVEWSSKPARNGLYTRSMLVDVTQRVLLEQAKAALEFSLESGQVGEWDLDLVNDISRRSLRHDQCFGYARPIPESEWGAATFLAHIHADDRGQVTSTMQEAIVARRDWSVEFRVIWPDASVHWLVAKGKVYRTEDDGSASRMLGIVMDITDRKRAEEAVAAAGQLARGQVDALTSTLEALAMESVPERLLEHVLRTMTTQLGAQSSIVWIKSESSGQFEFRAAYECGKFFTPSDPSLPMESLVLPLDGSWPWSDVFTHARHSVVEDVRTLRPSPWSARLIALGVITILHVPICMADRVQGAIAIRFTTRRSLRREEIELTQALAHQAMLSMQLTKLSAQSRETAVMAERNRMARDIHDTLAQGLTGVIVQLEAAADATSRGLSDESARHLARAQGLARESLTEARRSVLALRPQELENKELCEALDGLVHRMTDGTSVNARFLTLGTPFKLPAEWEDNILRAVKEVLTNVLRHARAKDFDACIDFQPALVQLGLRDNGCGFDPGGKFDGFGLLGIDERVKSMGGSLTLKSEKGMGTHFSIALPVAPSPPALSTPGPA